MYNKLKIFKNKKLFNKKIMKLLRIKKFREIFKFFVIIISFSLIFIIIQRDNKIQLLKIEQKLHYVQKLKKKIDI